MIFLFLFLGILKIIREMQKNKVGENEEENQRPIHNLNNIYFLWF